jgi:hexosaminidase
MIFPRIAALAEVAWTETVNKDFDFFTKRLTTHFTLLDRMKVNYAKSIFEIKTKIERNPLGEGILVLFSTLDKNLRIEYWYPEAVMNFTYNGPILINKKSANYDQHVIYAQAYSGKEKIGDEFVLILDYNSATGKNIVLRKQPAKAYNTGGDLTLVDGITGRVPWVGSEWLGFSGDTLDATIDLLKDTLIRQVEVYWLNAPSSWIYRPQKYIVEISSDGKNYRRTHGNPADSLAGNYPVNTTGLIATADILRFPKDTKARYIRIIIAANAEIPQGNPGEGHPAWLFISEIEIK